MYSPDEYNNALNEIKRLRELERRHNEAYESEMRVIRNKYWDLESELKRKKAAEEEVVESKKTAYKDKMTEEKRPFNNIINDIEEIYKLIGIHKDCPVLEKDLTEDYFWPRYGDRRKIQVDPFDYIINTDHIKIGVFILSNDKPVNKHTLKLKVRSIFDYVWRELEIDKEITYAPTVEELKTWYKKHKGNLKWNTYGKSYDYLSDTIKELNELEEKYTEAVELYKKKEWKLAYLEYQKNYYEHHYVNGMETEGYKIVLEEIKILNTSDENLPLLMGEVTTEKGLHELEKRLQSA